MTTTVSINIGGLAFSIDEDAYLHLSNYLDKVRRCYSKEDGIDEILTDIESRIADLFRSKASDIKTIITLADVNSVIETMGQPEDFEDNVDVDQKNSRRSGYNRIYRDVDNSVLGGVCSGIASYWQFNLYVVRVCFLLFAFLFGIGAFIYLILWIVLPPALSTVQKIEMRGRAVNIENIKSSVKDELNNVKKNMNL